MPRISMENVAAPRLGGIVRDLYDVAQRFLDWYQQQSVIKRVLLGILGCIGVMGGILMLIFHKYFIDALVYVADSWHDLSYGGVILFLLVFFVSFPPLLGFSALSILTGMVYGFPNGWPLLAVASLSGSVCSFLFTRYWLHDYAIKLVNKEEIFRAFAEILKEDKSLYLLILLRLCPLPYSLSNGALAAIPELPVLKFFLSSLITSPKLLIHLFVGYKLKNLGDETNTTATKFVDFLSIVLTGLAASVTTYVIYNKMQSKLQGYHNSHSQTGFPPVGSENYDRIIFGDFEDDLELGATSEIELNSADFDDDNFIIQDEDDVIVNDQTPLTGQSEPLGHNLSIMKDNDKDIIIEEELPNKIKSRDY
ncbi:putative transport vesicle protein [Scheffersomyces coipomensis]|uniref:putative transport vesicle protein n=1 Tax=Scheffersomyces coipomensis TaxID=1788519 RepID=UPI00315DED76